MVLACDRFPAEST